MEIILRKKNFANGFLRKYRKDLNIAQKIMWPDSQIMICSIGTYIIVGQMKIHMTLERRIFNKNLAIEWSPSAQRENLR